MTLQSDLPQFDNHDVEIVVVKKAPWITPEFQTIAAGQAEVGTRTSHDGPFTTS